MSVYFKHCCIAAGLLALTTGACGSDDGPQARYGARTNSPDSALAGTGARASTGGNGASPITGSAGSAARAGSGASSTGPAKNNDPNVCASAEINASRVTPTVYFVIDGSGSMHETFGSGTRWTTLRDALIGDTGVITQLEGVVKFGASIYSNNDARMCPAMSNTAAALQNLSNIRQAYPDEETGGGTPTGEALQIVVDGLPDYNNTLDQVEPAPIIILATDGEPNGCGGAAGGGGAQCDWTDFVNCLNNLATLASAPVSYDSTLAAVRAARAKNIPLWVISLADGLNNIPDLQKAANIGAGMADDASPGAQIYSPQNSNDLVQTLAQLLGAVVSCDVKLDGQLDVTRACEGRVTMSGKPLECNGDQGWKPLDATHIALQGSACDSFKSDPSVLLTAMFPCDVVVPQ